MRDRIKYNKAIKLIDQGLQDLVNCGLTYNEAIKEMRHLLLEIERKNIHPDCYCSKVNYPDWPCDYCTGKRI